MASAPPDPVPFEIVKHELAISASNGKGTILLLEPGTEGRIFRRRAVKALQQPPTAEVILPRLNELAGQLLANPTMPGTEVAARLSAITAGINNTPPERIEWAVAELNGVRAYFNGVDVIVTTKDLVP